MILKDFFLQALSRFLRKCSCKFVAPSRQNLLTIWPMVQLRLRRGSVLGFQGKLEAPPSGFTPLPHRETFVQFAACEWVKV